MIGFQNRLKNEIGQNDHQYRSNRRIYHWVLKPDLLEDDQPFWKEKRIKTIASLIGRIIQNTNRKKKRVKRGNTKEYSANNACVSRSRELSSRETSLLVAKNKKRERERTRTFVFLMQKFCVVFCEDLFFFFFWGGNVSFVCLLDLCFVCLLFFWCALKCVDSYSFHFFYDRTFGHSLFGRRERYFGQMCSVSWANVGQQKRT